MEAIKDWDNVQAYRGGGSEQLPAGGYVCKINAAKVTPYKSKDGDYSKLEVALDVVEGDYTGYYKRRFDSDVSRDPAAKWKGVLRLTVPKGDGSDKDEFSKRVLKGFTSSLESSNSGYEWDWQETKLKGLLIGILVRDKEYDFNGHHGFYGEIFGALPADDIREGNFKIPDKKLLGTSSSSSQSSGGGMIVDGPDDDDYPF